MQPTGTTARPLTALVACRVLEAEIGALAGQATHIVRREFFEIGLHDQPTNLRGKLAAAIERAENDPAIETVVLAYGLCGLALVDLSPRRCPLVVPRAHDCFTLFLGSRQRYAECMRSTPGLYWYSPGWNRDKRVPGPDREAKLRAEYTEKYGADKAEALMEMDREAFAPHNTAAYTDLRLAGDDEHLKYAQQCAHTLGWHFAYHAGDRSLLFDLLHGPWDDDRFLIVRPGQRVVHTADEKIVKALP